MICDCGDVLLPLGVFESIELDGSHHGPVDCYPCPTGVES